VHSIGVYHCPAPRWHCFKQSQEKGAVDSLPRSQNGCS
jgi:hypothetical protein